MKKLSFFYFFMFLLYFPSSMADKMLSEYQNSLQENLILECGGTHFNIHKMKSDQHGFLELYKTIVSAKKNQKFLKLVFKNDYFFYSCLKDKRENELMVFQSYCAGSACKDMDNYGIIKPNDLKVLLNPSDSNHNEAFGIIGYKIPPLSTSK